MEQKTFDRQTAKFLGMVGENMPIISREVMQEWIENPAGLQKALREAFCPPEVPQIVALPPPFLEFTQTVTISGATRFVAADFFKKDTGRKAKVWIRYLADDFKSVFVPKIEENVPDTNFRISRLKWSANNEAIRRELPKDHEAFLAHLAHLVSQQPHGESGVLLTKGYANIFYMFAADGSLWEVYANWNADVRGGGWWFSARPVTNRVDWRGGDQVFSRNSGALAI